MPPKSRGTDNFERKGGYSGPRVRRTDLKPPPASATTQRPEQSQQSGGSSPASTNNGTS